MSENDPGERALLRHTLATLAYRAGKVLRDAPGGFAAFRGAEGLRTPGELVGHLGDLLEWAASLSAGSAQWRPGTIGEWSADVDRFYAALARLDSILASDAPLGGSPRTLFQAPIADALTHVGQLAMLRNLAGAPIRPESYAKAAITIGRVGIDQEKPGKEFEGDASARKA